MRVLIADDDAISRQLTRSTLERSGFQVTSVEDGKSAADSLASDDGPRMAILDWEMPDMDGPSVCRYIRSRTNNPYVYLILLTSREGASDVVTGLEAGADDYLIKPCRPDELRARVRAGERVLQLQDNLLHEANHDSLTGLPNRSFFTRCLSENVQRTRERSHYKFAVLFVDIDRFKIINDTLGHLAGDELMKGVAGRLLEAVRGAGTMSRRAWASHRAATAEDLVARIGGDEFVILLPGISDASDSVQIAERIAKLLEVEFAIDGKQVFVTASVGISTSQEGRLDAAEMLRGADGAMYKAKVLGKARYAICQPSECAVSTERVDLVHDLRGAIEKGEIEVHYQPIVALSDGRVASLEALARWRHPSRGMIQPGAFIPVAEETGLMPPIGRWVMREACRQMRYWNTALPSCASISVAVNISPRQFEPRELTEYVKRVLEETGLAPTNLELEVTENLTMQDAVRAGAILCDLNGLGISLSLDDFGTGYSSLSYLHRFPIATLKVDRSFIADLQDSRESCAVVQTIISLGHNLGMKVIAEGIETQCQLDILRTLGCDLGQGFLFSRPVEASKVPELLAPRRLAWGLRLREATIDGEWRAA